MDITRLLEKKKRYEAVKGSIPEATLASFENAFEVEYTHHSTAIEGNTLTLMETKVVLEDGIAVGGKSLREIYEVVNHNKAYRYVKECITKGFVLEENIVKDIHALLMENIFTGGIYRREEVVISGASHTPPAGNEMYARLLMNYQLMSKGFLPVYIAKENRLAYYNALDAYAAHGELEGFADMLASLEEKKLEQYLGQAIREQ